MFKNKIILITGGTGSFGNAFLKKILDSFDFKEIRILSRDEKKQDDMRKKFNNKKIKYFLGDVRNSSSIKSAIEDSNTKDSIQFTHKLFTDGVFESEYVEYVMKIMKALEEKEGIVCTTLHRAKCNLVPQDISYGIDEHHPPHIDSKDVSDNTYTLVYYVNDSDGDTFVFNEKYEDEFTDLTIAHRQTPTEGSALLFKSTNYHASSSPINTKSRVVINIVFEADEA
jgi:hypothetical protein